MASSGLRVCSFCSSSRDLSAENVCGFCADLPNMIRAGSGIFWCVSKRQYFSVGQLRGSASRSCAARLCAQTAGPRIVLDFHGVADLFTPAELHDLFGERVGQAMIVSYVKPLGEIRQHAQRMLEGYSAVGFQCWLSFVKPPIVGPPLPGTKGQLMATLGSQLLIDDHAEHIASAIERGCSGMLVASKADVESAIALALAGPTSWGEYRSAASSKPHSATKASAASAKLPHGAPLEGVRCPDWNAGYCKLGASCKFQHGAHDTACKYYPSSYCRHGDACEFRHEDPK